MIRAALATVAATILAACSLQVVPVPGGGLAGGPSGSSGGMGGSGSSSVDSGGADSGAGDASDAAVE